MVSEILRAIKRIKHSAIKVWLFCYDSTYMLSIYVNIASSTANK